MNRIILVGNGFDLAHNLPTKYEDFINWYSLERFKGFENKKTCKDDDLLCKLIMNVDIFKDIFGKENYISLHNFYVKNSNGKFKGLLDIIKKPTGKFEIKSSPLFDNIIKSIETKGWVDIENEYYNFLRSFLSEKKYDDPKQLNDELDFIRTKLIEYLTLVNNKCINEKILNEDISKKILKPINKADLSNEATEYFKKVTKFEGDDFLKKNVDYEFKITEHPQPENILILDFNYTKTADLYLSKGWNITINHIHGDLENSDSVIFGYGDELDRDYKELSRLNNNELLRNIKSIKYMESSNYRSILSFIGWKKFQIYIMGHSCGNSDRTLMNTLFEHENCASIKPFYYQGKNGDDNYLDIVQNISRNFTDMKLMRDRVVNKKLCEPLPQNDSTKKQEI